MYIYIYRLVFVEGANPQVYFIVDSPLREKHDNEYKYKLKQCQNVI